jgi:anti-anti-sigma regulatory factor
VSQEREDRDAKSSRFAIDVERPRADTAVVQVSGEVIGNAVGEMQRTTHDELTRSPAQLIIDLSTVTRIEDGAIDVLVSAAGIAGEADISFCLVDPGGNPVADALVTAMMTELFEVFATVDDAMRAYRQPPEYFH